MASYYTPMQLQMLQWARNYHPDQLGVLRSMYSQVQPINQGTVQNAAQSALDQYQRNQAAPALAKEIASDGPNASSFAAARQAALQSQAALEGTNIYNIALANGNQNSIATQQAQQQQENQAWNDWYGPGAGLAGGDPSVGGGYSPYAGSSADARLSGNTTFNKVLNYGGQSLGNLANNYLRQSSTGQSPLFSLGQSVGNVAKTFQNPGASFMNGFNGAKNGTSGSTSPSSGGWGQLVPEPPMYGSSQPSAF